MVILCMYLIPFSLTSVFAEDQYSENLIPKMTSNTAPTGIASASTEWDNQHKAFRAFNHADELYGWATNGTTSGWISYEFESSKVINKYTVLPRASFPETINEAPKDWTFEGWDGSTWIVLDTRANIGSWVSGAKKEFVFDNSIAYKIYRMNITANNDYHSFTAIGELEMMSKVTTPTPTPTPTPPADTNGTLLTIYLANGQIKEYDLSVVELENFLTWFDNRANDSGPQRYAFIKTWNKGPFKTRTEYVVYDKIVNFDVDEYEEVAG